MEPSQTKCCCCKSRLFTGGLAAVAILIGLFYGEEYWRGKSAWNQCKGALQAQGVKMDWADYIPAPVPENQNVFGVPEMQKWFTGEAKSELTKKLFYQGRGTSNGAPLIAAELKIRLPGSSAPNDSGVTVLKWEDPQARTEVRRLLKEAIGPITIQSGVYKFSLRTQEEIRPAQIVLECQKAPSKKDLQRFLEPSSGNAVHPDDEHFQLGTGSRGPYRLVMSTSGTIAEYLKWIEELEPEFTLIRKALQRPEMRMEGDYRDPAQMPEPNFETVRVLSDRLALLAQCHLMQGKPEEALRDLTFVHDVCRILEGRRPMNLAPAMMNAAMGGMYVEAIGNCMRWHVLREAQLAALEAQLQQINLLAAAKQGLAMEPVMKCNFLETAPQARVLDQAFDRRKQPALAELAPRGWFYQNMVIVANLYPSNLVAALEPASQMVYPDKESVFDKKVQTLSTNQSLDTALAVRLVPNYGGIVETAAHNQTMVNEAIIACALERYHLAHGEYPETADVLAPQFIGAIPHDVIGGKPLHYRRMANGTFALYSVGWNGRDDGGTPGKSMTDGDWVW